MRPLLYANVVFAGGNSLLPGFASRVQGEIRRFGTVPPQLKEELGANSATVSGEGGDHAAAAFDGCRVLLACGYVDGGGLWIAAEKG